ncbi:hypothetical protein VSP9026_00645 [Vibrio spartinae]|uniref:DUF2066 domain-containing protein n=2 Tax=Vibrio spartinae TaxID=1918945 RepID=A0A1N6M0S8_9VIBR|nr:hypothetical protein VSP9026_00645 [Vibrio spartinae]
MLFFARGEQEYLSLWQGFLAGKPIVAYDRDTIVDVFWITMRNFACLILLCLTFSGYAATQVNIYRSEVTLDQEQDESQARIQGMENVIIRATGEQDAVNNPVVKKALSRNRLYLSQISYGQKDDQKIVKMQFSAKQIRTLLTQAQLPFWPVKRATILVWYVEDQNFQRNIAWENVANANVQQLKQLAEKRGLPLIVPVGDFDDITSIEASDIWGEFLQPIRDASERYHPDAILIIRAQSDTLNWKLYDQTPEKLLDISVPPMSGRLNGNDELAQLIHQLTQYYAKKNRVVVAGQSSHSMILNVKHLSRAVHFFKLEQALNQLSSVASVDVIQIQGDEVTFRVHLLTTQEEFEQELASLNLIEQLPKPDGEMGFDEQPATPSQAEQHSLSEETAVNGTVTDQALPEQPLSEKKLSEQPLSQPSPEGDALKNSTGNKSVNDVDSQVMVNPPVNLGRSSLQYQWRQHPVTEQSDDDSQAEASGDTVSQGQMPQDTP